MSIWFFDIEYLVYFSSFLYLEVVKVSSLFAIAVIFTAAFKHAQILVRF